MFWGLVGLYCMTAWAQNSGNQEVRTLVQAVMMGVDFKSLSLAWGCAMVGVLITIITPSQQEAFKAFYSPDLKGPGWLLIGHLSMYVVMSPVWDGKSPTVLGTAFMILFLSFTLYLDIKCWRRIRIAPQHLVVRGGTKIFSGDWFQMSYWPFPRTYVLCLDQSRRLSFDLNCTDGAWRVCATPRVSIRQGTFSPLDVRQLFARRSWVELFLGALWELKLRRASFSHAMTFNRRGEHMQKKLLAYIPPLVQQCLDKRAQEQSLHEMVISLAKNPLQGTNDFLQLEEGFSVHGLEVLTSEK